jgi:endonuclease/exonuclease/phosphatase family metal-dependent hydrolase
MQQLTIVSFNAHAGLQPRRDGRCTPYDLVEVLRRFDDADVIVLQESFIPDDEPAAVQKVAAELGAQLHELPLGRLKLDPWPQLSNSDPAATGTTGIAVLSRLPSTLIGKLPVGQVFADPARERGALHVELDVNGLAVDLVGVHLTSRLPHGPPIQMSRLRSQLPEPGKPAIVAGDHNFWGPGVVTFLRGWRRAVRGRSWPASRPHSQIDHILVRPETQVVSGEVLADVGSDHRPVRAVLRFGENAPYG